ncbi:glycine/betaine ABC transporter substrate-binding protein [Microbacterium sorbitolivorans]|uniref:Glycine/betaine ABC transporter substrate-binding protein n=1 Tax=Microbacterium sorbitolivorans TaxID=1867410 RepID=A0A367Y6J6_9MICO|nr:glycine betaine ABC transporter substrate-binding protein [Microbacterium sorbitolivorans]RCK61493.1 glycine/betaine ABC transporter substrate-binding protein [Microbacterium sorbitolivorans]GGF31705.1 glycine/betaine ABC transporter substrate-binding protein [Microbacterium sorbitolivorans]
MLTRNRKLLFSGAALGAATLALAGCVATADDVASGGSSSGDDSKGTLTIPAIAGWDEGVASSELWKAVLEEQGYTVNVEYADAATVYAGLAAGDYDFYTDTWMPLTHKTYMEKYGDDIATLGTWNEDAQNTIAVNADAPIDSLTELADHADEFGNTIVGIEPGAGLTEATQNKVIPTYGLEGMDYQTSSTAAMLTELQASADAGENIVVTLWQPHWAYSKFDLKNLEDPENTLGDAETMRVTARADFADEFPEVAEWLSNFEMSLDQLQSLEAVMFSGDEQPDDFGPVVSDWIADNQDYVDGLTA